MRQPAQFKPKLPSGRTAEAPADYQGVNGDLDPAAFLGVNLKF
jgi:hypothetical protein